MCHSLHVCSSLLQDQNLSNNLATNSGHPGTNLAAKNGLGDRFWQPKLVSRTTFCMTGRLCIVEQNPPMMPKAEATCFKPWVRYLLAEYLFPSSSMIKRSLISFSVYSMSPSSTSSRGCRGEGKVRSIFRRRQLVPSLVEPTT